jgi:hypothetical protein
MKLRKFCNEMLEVCRFTMKAEYVDPRKREELQCRLLSNLSSSYVIAIKSRKKEYAGHE